MLREDKDDKIYVKVYAYLSIDIYINLYINDLVFVY